MAEFVQIYHKAIDANVPRDIPVKIVKKKKVIVDLIHVQHVQCAKMKRVVEISHAYAEVVTPAAIVMLPLIHAQ